MIHKRITKFYDQKQEEMNRNLNKAGITLFYSLIFISVLIFLENPLIKLLNELWIVPVASVIEQSFAKDLIFIFSLITVVSILCLNIERKITNIRVSVFSILFISLYLFERSHENLWHFTRLEYPQWSWLAYSDIAPFAAFVYVMHFFIPKRRYHFRPESNSELLDDAPIEKFNNLIQDDFGYSNYASQIAEKILHTDPKRAFSIGITGAWGRGKTSMLNLITTSLNLEENPQLKIIEFYPWDCKSSEVIQDDFFNTLHNQLFDEGRLAKLINQYSSKLNSIQSSRFSTLIEKISEYFISSYSASQLREKINLLIKNSGIKLIIKIDDLDRLEPKEVYEVLRIIRNTGNFINTFFLVGYDRDYINKALELNDIPKSSVYLEKIFQLEVSLPSLTPNYLKKSLVERLSKKFENSADSFYKHLINHNYDFPFFTDYWLKSNRDVTRIYNSFILNYTKLEKQVEVRDYYLIELLRIYHPLVFEESFRSHRDFLKVSGNVFEFIESTGIDNRERYSHFGSANAFSKLLVDNEKLFKLSRVEEKMVNYLMMQLFSPNRAIVNSKLTIRRIKRFSIYARFGLGKSDIDLGKLAEARESGRSSIVYFVKSHTSDNQRWQLKEEFEILNDFEDVDDFIAITNGMIENAKLLVPVHSISSGLDSGNFLTKIISISQKELNELEISKLLNFISNLSSDSSIPFSIRTDILSKLYYSDEAFRIPNNKLIQECIENLFEEFAISEGKINWDFWDLYHLIKVIPKVKGEFGIGLNEKCYQLFEKWILPYQTKELIDAMIAYEPIGNKIYYKLSKVVIDLMRGYDDLHKYVMSLESFPCKEEALKFLELANKKSADFIEFQFSCIDVEHKIPRKL